MAYSYSRGTYPAGTQVLTVSFKYRERTDVKVTINDKDTIEFTWDSDSIIRLNTALPEESVVEIRRETPMNERAVDFEAANGLSEADLDDSNIQVFDAAQEGIDVKSYTLIRAKEWDDALDAKHTDWNEVQDGRIAALETKVPEDARLITYTYTATGGEKLIVVPFEFYAVSLLHINGLMQVYPTAYTYNTGTRTVELAEPLNKGDDVSISFGTQPDTIIGDVVVPIIQPTQFGDGVNKTFQSPHTSADDRAASLRVHINGLYQTPVEVFDVDGAHQITFFEAPPIGSKVEVTFLSPQFLDKTDVTDATVTATGSTTARTLGDRFSDVVNVKDFGAKGDGVTDDTDAIQAALDSLEPNGASTTPSAPFRSVCFFPAGSYVITETLNVPRGIRVEGSAAKTQKICVINMVSDTSKPIFDLFGCELPDGNRVADQTICNIHFWNASGYAIRAVKSDYPTATSHGSISINNCHFLNCNGDFVVQGEYFEIITGNTFDYAQVGHVKAVSVANCYGNEFYRGVGGSVILDSDLGAVTTLVSNITANSFKESGSASGATDTAITVRGAIKHKAVNVSNNTFEANGGRGIACVRSKGDIASFTLNNNVVDGYRTTAVMDNHVDNALVVANNISNTTGDTSSFPNIHFNSADSISVLDNMFHNTANPRDINLIAVGHGYMFNNMTTKVSVGNSGKVNYINESSDLFEHLYTKKTRYQYRNADGTVVNQDWVHGSHAFMQIMGDDNQPISWDNKPAVLRVNKNKDGRSIATGGDIHCVGEMTATRGFAFGGTKGATQDFALAGGGTLHVKGGIVTGYST